MKKFYFCFLLAVSSITVCYSQSWTLMDSTFSQSLDDMEFYDANTGLLSIGYVLYKTTDGAVTWDSVFTSASEIMTVSWLNSTTAFTGAMSGAINRSLDGGEYWAWVARPTTDVRHMDFYGNLNGIVVGDWCYIAYTTDGGATWTKLTTKPSGNDKLLYVEMVTDQCAFACGRFGAFIKSTDGGKTWTKKTSPSGSDDINHISFLDSLNGFAITGKKLFKTTDGGTTWTDLTANVNAGTNADFGAVIYIASDLIYAGARMNNSKIFKSTDGGTTWTVEFTHPQTVTSVSRFSYAGGTLYAMFDGGGDGKKIAKAVVNGGTSINEAKIQNITLYPNPADHEIHFAGLNETADYTAYIYDITGKLIREQKLTNSDINVSSFINGQYIIKLENNSGAAAYKMFIVNH